MKQLLLLALTLIMLTSCDRRRYQITESEILTEQGTVIAKQYQGTTTSTGNTVGISTSGNLTVGMVSMTSPKKFDVVFACEHGTIFTINKADIYAKVQEGDTVLIFYYERYRNNVLYDYKFIDVTKIVYE